MFFFARLNKNKLKPNVANTRLSLILRNCCRLAGDLKLTSSLYLWHFETCMTVCYINQHYHSQSSNTRRRIIMINFTAIFKAEIPNSSKQASYSLTFFLAKIKDNSDIFSCFPHRQFDSHGTQDEQVLYNQASFDVNISNWTPKSCVPDVPC